MNDLKKRTFTELIAEIDDIQKGLVILKNDCNYITKMFKEWDTEISRDFWARTNIKFSFVHLELLILLVNKNILLIDYSCSNYNEIAKIRGWNPLTEENKKQLINPELVFNKSNTANDSKRKRFLQKLFDTIRIFENTISYEHPIDQGDHRFDYLKKALEYRNRLTHPKSEKDLHIERDAYFTYLKGIVWLHQHLHALHKNAKHLLDTIDTLIYEK